MRARLGALALAALAVWAGCTVWNDAELPQATRTSSSSSSSSASSTSSSGSAALCPEAAGVPLTAPAPALGTGGDVRIVLALREISLGLAGGKVDPKLGYDLDGVCSCQQNGGSCAPRNGATNDAGACDGEGGRDNGTGAMLAELALAVKDPSFYANEALALGERGIIARVDRYNGQPNDDEVRFALYRARSPSGPPAWSNPDHVWDIDKTDLKTGGAEPLEPLEISTGFVKDGLLVVSDLATTRIPFNADADLRLRQVRITAKLQLDAATNRWTVSEAVAVGRWPLDDALQTVARVQNPTDATKRLCETDLLMAAARAKICGGADIMVDPKQDREGRACNAVSTAIGLTMVPAALGQAYEPARDDTCVGKDIGACD